MFAWLGWMARKKVWVKCPRCGYVWETNSVMLYVTCPNCLRKVERIKALEEYEMKCR